jgi:hypothetical protein
MRCGSLKAGEAISMMACEMAYVKNTTAITLPFILGGVIVYAISYELTNTMMPPRGCNQYGMTTSQADCGIVSMVDKCGRFLVRQLCEM